MSGPNAYPMIRRFAAAAVGVVMLSGSYCDNGQYSSTHKFKTCGFEEVEGQRPINRAPKRIDELGNDPDALKTLATYPEALLDAANRLEIYRRDETHNSEGLFHTDAVDNAGDILCQWSDDGADEDEVAVYYDYDGLDLLAAVTKALEGGDTDMSTTPTLAK
jgi:hypothetical protein